MHSIVKDVVSDASSQILSCYPREVSVETLKSDGASHHGIEASDEPHKQTKRNEKKRNKQ